MQHSNITGYAFCAEYNNDELVHGFGALSLVCLVVALVGIKLKWFKHRLTFNEERGDAFSAVASTSNEVYSTTEGASSVYRSSAESSEPQIIRATFRRFDEMDVIPLAEPPRKCEFERDRRRR